jgi:hypothetical protein
VGSRVYDLVVSVNRRRFYEICPVSELRQFLPDKMHLNKLASNGQVQSCQSGGVAALMSNKFLLFCRRILVFEIYIAPGWLYLVTALVCDYLQIDLFLTCYVTNGCFESATIASKPTRDMSGTL